ncbi:MAG: hypothetical protein JOZ22_18790 [Acidobacteriia bacterium]|nr:hypothetical protein [Terriglobia bacterium]
MTTLDFFARTPLAQAAGAAVFHSLWQGAIIGACWARYWAWSGPPALAMARRVWQCARCSVVS